MCGICGVIAAEGNPTHFEPAVCLMLGSLRHRGPDGSGMASFSTPAFSGILGHTRLSIIDLTETGDQPMRSGDDILSFNGEIFNFRELAPAIRAAGIELRSTGDTEVLLKSIAISGPDTIKDLRGMFALAQYAGRERAVYLARDEFGIKPLYYYHRPDQGLLVFASEIRTLLASGLVPRRVSKTGLRSILAFGSAVPPATIVDGVRVFPAGAWAGVTDVRKPLVFHRYVPASEDWTLAQPESDDRHAEERFTAELEQSVKVHLISDARLGCFLSGGVDSSTLALLSSKASAGPVETFCLSVGRDVNDESAAAGETAAILGTKHTAMQVDTARLSREFPEVLAALDQPSFDGANVYFISRESSRLGLKVMLSGLGGDEALGGYSFSRQSISSRVMGDIFDCAPAFPARWPRRAPVTSWNYPLQRVVDRMHEQAGVVRWLMRTQWMPSGMRALLLKDPDWEMQGEDIIPAELRCMLSRLPIGAERLNSDLKALALTRMSMTFLADTDVMSMASSQEVRVPFVDRKVFQAAFRIRAARKKLKPGKGPLREMLRRGGIITAADNTVKKGFHIPFARWLRDPEGPVQSNGALMDSLLDSPVFGPAAASLVREYFTGRLNLPWSVPYLLLVTADYCRRHSLSV